VIVSSTSFVFLIGFSLTLLVCTILVLTKGVHGRFSNDQQSGIQKFHIGNTPRIGGVAIAIGFFVGAIFLPQGFSRSVILIGLAGFPALFVGLTEDLTKQISVRVRLFATILSGLLFVFASGYALQDIGIPALNLLLDYQVVSLLFTAFAIGGVPMP